MGDNVGDMQIELVQARTADEPRLANLVQLYVYDFSELMPLDVGEDGRFTDLPLDGRLQDPDFFGYLIRVDGHWAGFAFVKRGHGADADGWDMSEFFVMRRYRRAGVGASAARQVFARHSGRWEVRQRQENAAATVFWRRVIDDHSGGRFTEERIAIPGWTGTVHRFEADPG